METNLSGMGEDFARALSELTALRQFPGAPKEFWPRFLAATATLASADNLVLLAGNPAKTPRWTKIGEWTGRSGPSRARAAFASQLEQTAERCLRETSFIEQIDETTGSFTIAIRLKLSRPEDEVVLACQST